MSVRSNKRRVRRNKEIFRPIEIHMHGLCIKTDTDSQSLWDFIRLVNRTVDRGPSKTTQRNKFCDVTEALAKKWGCPL